MQEIKDNDVLLQNITEANIINKNIINFILLLGSIGFLIVGISSYLDRNLLFFLDAKRILFFPQGLVMSIYGILGTLLSLNQIIILYYEVGTGYNEFNKKKGSVKIYRKGFPIQNDIDITFQLEDIEHILIDTKTELFNTNQTVLIQLKDKRKIPIIQNENFGKRKEIEERATELAYFLKAPLKGNF